MLDRSVTHRSWPRVMAGLDLVYLESLGDDPIMTFRFGLPCGRSGNCVIRSSLVIDRNII